MVDFAVFIAMASPTARATPSPVPAVDTPMRPPQLAPNSIGDEALRNRWGILAVLFTVRLTIAFQFQSVAAVAPLLGHDFGVGLAEIGLLIGLYFTPGVALSLPGGAIGQRFGDKLTVLGALAHFAVGTRVTSRPPHRSVRAAFPHTAPTSGVNGENVPYASQLL